MKKLRQKTNALYLWLLYYPYLIFFYSFEPSDSEDLGTVGTDINGDEVYVITAVASLKFIKFIKVKVGILFSTGYSGKCGVRFLSEKDLFGYRLGAQETEPMTNLIYMRLV